jgi:hypothetical protein
MKAEIVWGNKRFLGIPYRTPDYRLVSFSDGTSLVLDREKQALVIQDGRGQAIREFAIESEELNHLFDLRGKIELPDGALFCRPKWSGGYEFKHEKLGSLTNEWIQFAQKDRKELFELYAIASPTAVGTLDSELQKVLMALELAMRHNFQ